MIDNNSKGNYIILSEVLMDIDEMFGVLRWFDKTFPEIEDAVKQIDLDPPIFAVGFRFEKWLIILMLSRGKRGKINDWMIVVDPNQRIEADRLQAAFLSNSWSASWLRMHCDIENKKTIKEFLEVAPPALTRAVQSALKFTSEFRVCVLEAIDTSYGNALGSSIHGFCGGLPRT